MSNIPEIIVIPSTASPSPTPTPCPTATPSPTPTPSPPNENYSYDERYSFWLSAIVHKLMNSEAEWKEQAIRVREQCTSDQLELFNELENQALVLCRLQGVIPHDIMRENLAIRDDDIITTTMSNIPEIIVTPPTPSHYSMTSLQPQCQTYQRSLLHARYLHSPQHLHPPPPNQNYSDDEYYTLMLTVIVRELMNSEADWKKQANDVRQQCTPYQLKIFNKLENEAIAFVSDAGR